MSTLPSPTTGSAAGLISEKQFQATVIEYAKACGWKVYHTYDSRRSEPGFPDLVLVRGSECAFVELKAVGGKMTQAQKEWRDALSAVRNIDVALWTPAHLPYIEKWLGGAEPYA